MTDLSDFHAPLRVILGDRDPDIHIYDSDQLTEALKLVLNLGKVPGYAVGDDGETVDPEIVPKDDPTAFARILFHAARRFVVTLTSNSFKTRAFSESFGHSRELIDDILKEAYELEHGEMGE